MERAIVSCDLYVGEIDSDLSAVEGDLICRRIRIAFASAWVAVHAARARQPCTLFVLG